MLPVVKSLRGLDVHCFVVRYSQFVSEPERTNVICSCVYVQCAILLLQGYIHPSDYKGSPALVHMTDGLDTVLPSLSMSSLTRSSGEVSQIFHLPLSYLVDTNRLRQHNLPNRPPYHAIDVTDLIVQTNDALLPPTLSGTGDEVDSRAAVRHVEVWGLTGWHVNKFMRRLGAY